MRKDRRTSGPAEDTVRAPAYRRQAASVAVVLATHRLSKSLRTVLQNWWRHKDRSRHETNYGLHGGALGVSKHRNEEIFEQLMSVGTVAN